MRRIVRRWRGSLEGCQFFSQPRRFAWGSFAVLLCIPTPHPPVNRPDNGLSASLNEVPRIFRQISSTSGLVAVDSKESHHLEVEHLGIRVQVGICEFEVTHPVQRDEKGMCLPPLSDFLFTESICKAAG